MENFLVISPLNSLTFKLRNDKLPSHQNTLSDDIRFPGKVPSDVYQRFKNTDAIRIQFQSAYAIHEAYLIDMCSGVSYALEITQVSDYPEFAFYELGGTSLAKGTYRIQVIGRSLGDDYTEYMSETFKVLDHEDMEDYLRVDYWNISNMQYMDYSTGIKHFFWIPAKLDTPEPGGEVDTYNNLGNVEKTEEIIQRVHTLRTYEIPEHLAIKLWEAMALDRFYINDVEYVTQDKAEREIIGNKLTCTVTAELTESRVIGVNSTNDSDTIIDPTDMSVPVKSPKIEDASGSASIAVTGGYMLRWIYLVLTSGASVLIDIGTTPGGNDLAADILLDSENPKTRENITHDFGEAGGVIYFTISGLNARVSIYTWQEQFKQI